MHYQRHTWPQLRRQPTFVDVPAGPNVKGVVRGGLIRRQVQPPAGNPGRPYHRALARAYAEDAKRRAPRPPKVKAAGHLPKATKLDAGTLAKFKDRKPQRLGRLCAVADCERQLGAGQIAALPTKAFLSVRTDHLHASARERILDARADFGR